jgi:hypothetical protein
MDNPSLPHGLDRTLASRRLSTPEKRMKNFFGEKSA